MKTLTKQLVRVFLFGNAVHERLIPLLIDVPNQIDYDYGYIFVHNENITEEEHAGFKLYTSPYVPFDTQLIVLPRDVSYSEMQPSTKDSIFFVDDWTFINSESLEAAKSYRQNYPYTELRIIMFDSNRKTLSTDISDVKTALENAKYEYEQDGFSVTIIQESDISKLFFWQYRKYNDMLKVNFNEKLQRAKERVELYYEMDYEDIKDVLIVEMLQPNSLERFTRYDENLGVSKIKEIIEISAKSFFDENSLFVKELSKIFKEFTKDICIWDEKKVFGNLVDILSQRFIETLRLTLPAVRVDQLNEISYHEFMSNTKFNVIFSQQCSVFFNDSAKNITKKYIDEILSKMGVFF